MDELDQQILGLLAKNARMPVKEIAREVSLTSPAVSSRIHRLEQEGVIGGYTVRINLPDSRTRVNALISLSIPPSMRESFLQELSTIPEVLQCFHLTGSYSFIVKRRHGSAGAAHHPVPESRPHQYPDHSVHPGGPQALLREVPS